MRLKDLINSKKISIKSLKTLIEKSDKPIYVLVAGSVGAGKSFIINKFLSDTDVIDPDDFTKSLGNETYNSSNVAKSMSLVRKAVKDKLNKKESFVQQGTSANLQNTIKKLIQAKKAGFKTVLLYVSAPIEQAFEQIQQRVKKGGHGKDIDFKKIDKTYKGSKLTFKALTGENINSFDIEDKNRIQKALDFLNKSFKDISTLSHAQSYVDFYVEVDNTYKV